MQPLTSGRRNEGRGTQRTRRRRGIGLAIALSGLAAAAPGAAQAAPLGITVIGVDRAGNQTPILNYRWTVEEDATKPSLPGVPANLSNYSYGFHTSYMPVVAAGKVVAGAPFTGHEPTDPDPDRVYMPLPDLDPARRYYVSVLPDQDGPANGYQMGGAPVAPGQTAVTVYVNKYPVPAAQLSVLVFQDDHPLNAAPDLPEEQPIAGAFIELVEAGGTYGASGGQVTQDMNGNPLGTTYDADGNVLVLGSGIVTTDANGVAVIRNLFPAKYTIHVRPPPGSDWVQTTTIEGTKGDDAWVKNAEPTFFQEFGPPGHHVFVGFTHRGLLVPSVMTGDKAITGRVVNIHNSHPPDYTFYAGAKVPKCWVGLNEPNGGRALYTTPCDAESRFAIPSVPAGTWELVVWDEPLDVIIASTQITVAPSDTVVDLIEVPVFNWFARYEGRIFYDAEENGFPLDASGAPKPGMSEVPVDIRFRDGSIYQLSATSEDGTFEFPELFPFFNWMVGEVDYSRFKATGATIVVDNGGPVPPDSGFMGVPSFGRLNPQPQFETDPVTGAATTTPAVNPNTGNNLSRTETGTVLLEGIQAFLGQTVHVEFGKKSYAFGENGGIAGIVQYAITRAEDDPQLAAAETWEPGVPHVQVGLYVDCDHDGKIDRPDPASPGACLELSTLGHVARLADVDNYPFCWRDPASCGLASPQRGPEDVVRSGDGTTFDTGDVFTWGSDPEAGGAPFVGLSGTDSWDASPPTGCQPDPAGNGYQIPYGSDAGTSLDCYDGLRDFNQARPAVFDGGYAFGRVAFQDELPNVDYVVEAVAPPGYRHQGSGDKNVTFGDILSPTDTAVLPPRCVGPELPVPEFLTLFPGAAEPNPSYAPGATWHRCDMKAVSLRSGQNPAPNFFLFTEAPVAGHAVGFILDDLSSEFDPYAPTFGEKHALPWLPVSVRDWTGREIHRVYSDQWGSYNFLVPSTFTINPPFPSGVSPNMVVSCMNSPGPIPDTRVGSPTYGQMILDPYFDRRYSQFCYTLQYLPGKTTYLDTPVVPVAAFAGPGQYPVDCELEDGTPVIYSVEGRTSGGVSYNGPFVYATGGGAGVQPQLVVVSEGTVQVPNPRWDPAVPGSTPTIPRDHGFGATQGDGAVTLAGTALPIASWSDGVIVARLPTSIAITGQLLVRRGSAYGGRTSVVGVTVTKAAVGSAAPKIVAPGQSIQAVIDDPNTHDGDLVLVAPGTYNEYVIMDKAVRLQGWGAPSTVINAAKFSSEGLKAWRRLLARKVDAQQPATCPAPDPDTGVCPVTSGPNRTFDLLPGQILGTAITDNEPVLFGAEEGPGVLVVGANPAAPSPNAHLFDAANLARIDGLTVTGGDSGGGVLASGYARFLQVSNNRIVGNYGTYGGGVRIGHTALLDATNDRYGGYTDSVNPNVGIRSNWIAENGSTEAGAGGGITLGNGATGYAVTGNYVCGNFSMASGGGIGHLGLSDGGLIANNAIVFNQTFNQSANVTGGGVFVGGEPPLAGALSAGTGTVTLSANLIQGNNSGAGGGGGVRIEQVNGLDVTRSPDDPTPWFRVSMVNNMVVDNVAGYAGGGVSLKDALVSSIVSNTIANNDSTATNMQSFSANPSVSDPQPAGLVAHANSQALQDAIGSAPAVAAIKATPFSSPLLLDDIVWHNRSFYWKIDPDVIDPVTQQPVYGLFDPITNTPAGTNPVYRDLAVLDTANQGTFAGAWVGAGVDRLQPTYCVLSETADVTSATAYGPASGPANTHDLALSDARFVRSYVNGNRQQSLIVPGITTTIQTAATVDEGGNFIDIRFGPLTRWNCASGLPQTYANCPLFGDYHLTSAGSGATTPVNNGLTVTGVTPATDFDGQPRPNNIDIGADELQ